MNKKKKGLATVWAGLLMSGLAGTVQAELIDRGNGLIYDSAQDLTWLQNANYAAGLTQERRTTIISAINTANPDWLSSHQFSQVHAGDFIKDGYTDGMMTWWGAMAWAQELNVDGHDDWRLPTITDTGNDGCNYSIAGTDCGFNVDTATSELAYMFHNILSNESWVDTNGGKSNCGSTGAEQDANCVQSTRADGIDILNLQSYVYWSDTEHPPADGYDNKVWTFHTDVGKQHYSGKGARYYAWAVHAGDVAGGSVNNVPEPGILLLLGAGLIGLATRWRGY